jgi:RNA polymerase sigma-70 factor (ECF subfamily)
MLDRADVHRQGHLDGSMTTPLGHPAETDSTAVPHAPPRASDPVVRRLYETHGSTLLSYLMKLTRGDRHRAEDILQETLLRAWRHPEARTEEGNWSRPWLFTVARRIAIDQMRAAQARPRELGDDRLDERAQPEDNFEKVLDRGEVRAALRALPQLQRDVLIEVYFRERSVQEAADILGVPPGTVKSRTFYALRALREALIDRGFLPSPDPEG